MNPADAWIDAHGADLVAWRRRIHAHPELARQEFATTALVVDTLRAVGLSPTVMPGGTGVVCDIGPAGPRIALRADMDALPLTEFTGAEYSSTVPGVSHACGHDAHTTVLLATGVVLASLPSLPHGVRLIFQPAEEVMPGGALDLVAAGVLDGVTQIHALHCDPRLEVGKVGIRVGAITSAADTVELRLHSAGGHTSRPHLTSDLVYALGSVVTALPGLLSRRVDPRTSTVMVWGAVVAGQAPNAIPQTGMLTGTVRTGDHQTWELLEPLVREIVAGVLAPTGVKFEVDYRRGVPPVVNDEHATRRFEAAIRTLGPDALADTAQSGGGEDFSWYLEHVPGAMARLGVWSGHGPQLDIHQPTFDLDERALAVGTRVMTALALGLDGPEHA
ncbi:M20 family metallopeptidase [Rhodococcus kroppenstedtii]|uniref:Amidohydrolase n=1 Tax=Rhodococcoides kroppenstedtii TaxID=293050 RepID=A0ABS7NRR7_9NOCA|nr:MULTISPECIES: M20 family metallopeptidase [Rhodococcus]AMY19457.1 putative hydrolase YxeP [Rhodococcus sp. PBTS 1]MBT1192373.1 amidohydrolase [Rhodococcus kroppenstedtii]MBY6312631.1 amidohydrolase [Rhodococcus kroppenstedtii]MBY6320701.1 amidohydrolase [Rhodococcus kroppenstedtii]MBY6399388.1 amidohydrolase [Rhodococcus kroppenstedtii]